MPTDTLDTLSRLQDIRLRICNRERVSPEEMHSLLLDIMRDREATARVAPKARAAARKAVAADKPPLSIDDLFGTPT